MPRISALTLSGGKLSEFGGIKAAKEFRIWVHPVKGDDYYYTYKNYGAARKAYEKAKKATKAQMKKQGILRIEQPIAVVANPKWRKGMPSWERYREVIIDKASLKVVRKTKGRRG